MHRTEEGIGADWLACQKRLFDLHHYGKWSWLDLRNMPIHLIVLNSELLRSRLQEEANAQEQEAAKVSGGKKRR